MRTAALLFLLVAGTIAGIAACASTPEPAPNSPSATPAAGDDAGPATRHFGGQGK